MKVDSKLEAALKGLLIKNADGQIALRTANFDSTDAINASGSQSPRSLENLLLGAIGLDADGNPAIRLTPVRPYKVFTALATQAGTDDPVLNVLENTLGVTVVAARTGVGTYTLTASADAFTDAKTAAFINVNGTDLQAMTYARTSDTVITLNSISGGAAADDVLGAGAVIEIKVYN